jgi:hypothetical protein
MTLMKKEKKRDLRYPRAVKAVTVLMVVVGLGIAGVATYVSVSGVYLATNLGTTLGSVMGAPSNGTGPIGMSNTSTSVKAWLVIPVNNTGAVGMDINDLVVDVTFTYLNGTSLAASTDVGSIPFGESKLANITLIDTVPSMAMGLFQNSSITMAISFAMRVTLPRSWGIFALTISDLEFGFTIPMPGGLKIS